MASESTESSSSSGSSQSTSTPISVQSPQTTWGLALSQALGALGQQQYNWALDQYSRGSAITDQTISQFMEGVGKAKGLTNILMDQYANVFKPLMDQYIQEAGTYNSEERQRFMMGRAESTVGQATKAALDSAERKLQGFGVNPNSGRYQDLLMTARVQDAAARAGAGTQAALDTADRGRSMLRDANAMGQNIPGMAVNALQAGYAGLTGAENAILGLINTGSNALQSAVPFFNAAAANNKIPPVGQQTQSSSQQSSQGNKQSQSDDGKGGGKGDGQGQGKSGGGQGNGGQGGGQDGGMGIRNARAPQAPSTLRMPAPPKDGTGQDTGDQQNNGADSSNYNPFDAYRDAGMDIFDPNTYGGAQIDPNQFMDSNGNLTPQGDPNLGQGGSWDNVPGGGFNSDTDFSQFASGPQQTQGAPWQDTVNTGDFTNYNPASQWDNSDFGSTSQNYQSPDDAAQYNGGYGDYSGPEDYNDQYGGGDDSSYGSYDDTSSQGGSQDDGSGGAYDDYSYGSYDEGYKRGGAVRAPTTGGAVPRSASPSQGRMTDDIPARLNAGEYVIPRDVVAAKGTEFFNQLIAKSRKVRTGMAGPRPGGTPKPALGGRPAFVSRPQGGFNAGR